MIGRETKKVGISPVAAVFATPTLAAVLSVFARNPERTYIQRELVEETGGSLYLVQRELKRLEEAGLVARETRGRQVEYTANAHHPAFAGLREALIASVALGDRLRDAFDGVPGVRLAFIFGSVAEGTDTSDSDVDIFIVGDLGLREASERVVPATRDLGREPNIIIMNTKELRSRMAEGEHFVTSVLDGPRLWLVGDDDELEHALG